MRVTKSKYVYGKKKNKGHLNLNKQIEILDVSDIMDENGFILQDHQKSGLECTA